MLGAHNPKPVLFVSLSECDVGVSKAVVNGLAPGSNGQDKGKVLRGSPAGTTKQFYMEQSMLGLGHWPAMSSHWSNQVVN